MTNLFWIFCEQSKVDPDTKRVGSVRTDDWEERLSGAQQPRVRQPRCLLKASVPSRQKVACDHVDGEETHQESYNRALQRFHSFSLVHLQLEAVVLFMCDWTAVELSWIYHVLVAKGPK